MNKEFEDIVKKNITDKLGEKSEEVFEFINKSLDKNLIKNCFFSNYIKAGGKRPVKSKRKNRKRRHRLKK